MVIKIINLYSGNTFDPESLVEQGFSGVIFKAGQGVLWDVPYAFPEWKSRAESVGLDVGWFWVVDSRVEASRQVEAAKKATDLDFGALGMWADIEKPNRFMSDDDYWKTPYNGFNNYYNFMWGIEQATGKMPGFYSSPGFYNMVFGHLTDSQQEWFAQALLWTAQYPLLYIPGVSKPTMYGKWKTWTFWQYREGPDINLFNGDNELYKELFGSDSTPPQPPTGGDDVVYTGKVIATRGLSVRTEPSLSGLKIDVLPYNTHVDGVGTLVPANGYNWMNIVSPVEGWVASEFLEYEEVSHPPPPPSGDNKGIVKTNVYFDDGDTVTLWPPRS